jgi:predicted metal-dependent HD superfamily phosphohydrolase
MQSAAAIRYIIAKLENELPGHLHYHNAAHTLDVMQASEAFGKAEGLRAAELTLLNTAAAYHDAGFLCAYDDHEEHSCRIARESLPGFGYGERQIDRCCELILFTLPGHLPDDPLAAILCDADLDYLGRPDYPDIAAKLRKEWEAIGKSYEDDAWIQMQIAYLQQHQYRTASARQQREAGKVANIRYLKKLRQH